MLSEDHLQFDYSTRSLISGPKMVQKQYTRMAKILLSLLQFESSEVTISYQSTKVPRYSGSDTHLLRLGKTDAVASDIIDGVPPPEESITENSKRAHGLGEVHTHEGRDARTLDFEDIVKGTDGEVVAGKCESEVGQTVTFITLNSVLSIVTLLSANLLVPGRD